MGKKAKKAVAVRKRAIKEIKLNKRFEIKKVEGEYHIMDRDMSHIAGCGLVAKCSYINSSIVCDALNIQYNLTEDDRKKYNPVPKKLRNEKPRARNNKR